METGDGTTKHSTLLLKLLVFLMFSAFALTTDSVGTLIPSLIYEFRLGMAAAGSFHYATMTGIGVAALFLGFLADRLGRKPTILLGLLLFGLSSALFAVGDSFTIFLTLLFLSGLGIGIFKSAALALIGDVSRSTRDHSATMNLVEGFFGVGAIIGPAIVAWSLQNGASWKLVYLIAAGLCAVLVFWTFAVRFPRPAGRGDTPSSIQESVRMLRDPAALFVATAIMLYVGAEAAIYVWAPTYFLGYDGPLTAAVGYVVAIFFTLRAAGRFLGAWLIRQYDWRLVLLVCSGAMALLFVIAVAGGRDVAALALPATGLFMSVIYPTLNSTGISCFAKAHHGAIAGLLLFFTCVSAVVAPLIMGVAGDAFGSVSAIAVGAAFAVLLALMCAWNMVRDPVGVRLTARNVADYGERAA